jgi:hypothetical protein
VIKIRCIVTTAGIMLMLGAACTRNEPPTQRGDGGAYTLREACNVPSMNCYNGCFKREEGPICTGCCYDQRYLCDTGQQHSFESCDSTHMKSRDR